MAAEGRIVTCQHCTSEAVEDLVAAGFPYPTAVLLAEAGFGIVGWAVVQ